jgi:hypothetical protein
MADYITTSKVDVTVKTTFTVTEEEARALDALAGYGDDAAIKAFYEHCGKHYLQPYEKGLRSFLKTIRGVVSPALNAADKARKVLVNEKLS